VVTLAKYDDEGDLNAVERSAGFVFEQSIASRRERVFLPLENTSG